MIPKIIHYCWFGGREKPKKVLECIKSWKKNLEGYEIREWNEKNFNVNSTEFTKINYRNKNYAFVSDYVRIKALYEEGGIYLDTDVEVFKNFDMFLDNKTFWGFEEKNYIATSTIGAEKNNEFIGEFLEYYNSGKQIKDGEIISITNVAVITEIFKERGLVLEDRNQIIDDIGKIYKQSYFSPYDYINCYMKKDGSTVTVHHFHKSWLPFRERVNSKVKKIVSIVTFGKGVEILRKVKIGNR